MSVNNPITATANFAPAPNTFPLAVLKAGTGQGTVTSAPPGIDCGADCGESYAQGSVVTLTATPAAGSTFTGWSGACTGTGSCVVTMNAAQSVTATFDTQTFPLTVTLVGTGRGVSSNPDGHRVPRHVHGELPAGNSRDADGARCPGERVRGLDGRGVRRHRHLRGHDDCGPGRDGDVRRRAGSGIDRQYEHPEDRAAARDTPTARTGRRPGGSRPDRPARSPERPDDPVPHESATSTRTRQCFA